MLPDGGVRYRLAETADLVGVAALLESSGLPTADLAEARPRLFVATMSDKLVGSVGLELHGSSALLRSLAVAPAWRGRAISRELIRIALANAAEANVEHLFLLTTTAQSFFERVGFVAVTRATAPERIRTTREYRGLCPDTAILMRRELAR